MAVAASTGQPRSVRLWSRSRGDIGKNGNSPRRRDLKRASPRRCASKPQVRLAPLVRPGPLVRLAPAGAPGPAPTGRGSGEQNEQNAHSEHKRAACRLCRL